jgi:hypothetical protein
MTAATTMAMTDRQDALRRQVAGLCHLIRWVAAGWIVWSLAILIANWGDIEVVKRNWGHHLKLDLTALPALDYAAAFAVVLADWAGSAVVVFFVWRLFGCYLRGSIFTTEAAREMRNLGIAGIASVAVDMVVRPLLAILLSWHLGSGVRNAAFWIEPNDVLHAMMALFVVAVAHILKVGVEIADDNRQIV